jgi:sec-independent protein translocase protein TatB
MNFLGMGPMELVLIVVLALIVFGPAKLPEIMGQVGRAIGDFRRATSELSDEFNRTIQAELNETKQTIEETKSALTEVRSAVDSTVNETRAAVAGLPAPQRVAAPSPPVVSNGIEQHGTGGTNGSAPSLADTTQWSYETSSAAPEGQSQTSTENQIGGSATIEPAAAGSDDHSIAPPPPSSSSEPGPAAADEAAQPDAHEGGTPRRDLGGRDELLPPY